MAYPVKEEQRITSSEEIEEIEVLSVDICYESEDVYDLHVPKHNAFFTDFGLVSNCGEFLFIGGACNLASLNLMRFVNTNGVFDIEKYQKAIDVFVVAQDIICDRGSYPAKEIAESVHRFRTIGLGYANLGALLMAFGLPYDSDLGRMFSAGITSLLTARAYNMSMRLTERTSVFEKYNTNKDCMKAVIESHRKENQKYLGMKEKTGFDAIFKTAEELWKENEQAKGFRNAQVTLLAPTGCVVGDTMILSSDGLLPIRSWDSAEGQWQDVRVDLWQEGGKAGATKFYLNGKKPTVRIVSEYGHMLQGTGNHRVRILSPHGKYVWRRLDEIGVGDCLVLSKGGHKDLLGEKDYVSLTGHDSCLHPNANPVLLPSVLDERWSEVLGYYEGDGYLKERGGLYLVVSGDDFDVVKHFEAFVGDIGCTFSCEQRPGCVVVGANSYPLSRFFVKNGWDKNRGNQGQGAASARIPDAVLRSRTSVLCSFLRGLFEADGTVSKVGCGTSIIGLTTCSETLARQVLCALNSLGIEARLRETNLHTEKGHWGKRLMWRVDVSGINNQRAFSEKIGFISNRKNKALHAGLDAYQSDSNATNCCKHMGLLVDIYERLDGKGHAIRQDVQTRINQGRFNLDWARKVANEYGLVDCNLLKLDVTVPDMMLATVESVEDGGLQSTYDFTVPQNNTYVANAFISHNTISFLMGCDTTGIEPDFALIKFKKIANGETIKMFNGTVPSALKNLGYTEKDISIITAYLTEHDTLDGAPVIKKEHVPVFACASGNNAISYWGHIKMMAAVQPFLSMGISKTVNCPSNTTPEEIQSIYTEAWKMGVKSITVYRDGSKGGAPLSSGASKESVEREAPKRYKLEDTCKSLRHKYEINGHEGYFMVGLYEDGNPGELFVKMSKQGSTISGLFDAFSLSISLLLQHGVPLEYLVEKFSFMRFEPSGWTPNKDIKQARSPVDYIFRWMSKEFLHKDVQNGTSLNEEQTTVDDDILRLLAEKNKESLSQSGEEVVCKKCGHHPMQKTGACYTCTMCGDTSGCG